MTGRHPHDLVFGPYALVASDDYRVEIQCGPFGYPGAPQQTVEVVVNGQPRRCVRDESGPSVLRSGGADRVHPPQSQQVAVVRLTRLLRYVDQ